MVDTPELTIDGVTLTQFAFVRAGLVDGLELDALLGFLRLDAPTWEAAERAWDEQVLDAIEDEPSFLDALDAAKAAARTHWTRRIPPLDDDLRAWFDFLQAWLGHADPTGFLEEMKVSVADVTYLHRLWSDRLAGDAKLRAEALSILGEERREPPVPAPERPRLIQQGPRPRGSDGRTAVVARARAKALPFGDGEARPLPPPLAVPLPKRERPRTVAPGPDETRLGGTTGAEVALPFMAPSSLGAEADAPIAPVLVPTAWLPRREADMEEPVLITDPEATTAMELPSGRLIPIADAFERAPPTSQPLLTVEAHARLVAELTTGADLIALLARHGLTLDAKQSEDERWGRELDRDPEVRAAWMRAFEEARARLAGTGAGS